MLKNLTPNKAECVFIAFMIVLWTIISCLIITSKAKADTYAELPVWTLVIQLCDPVMCVDEVVEEHLTEAACDAKAIMTTVPPTPEFTRGVFFCQTSERRDA